MDARQRASTNRTSPRALSTSGIASIWTLRKARNAVRVIAPQPSSLDAAPDVLILREGSVASVRAGRPDDHHGIRRFFHNLSAESRYRRFFSAGEPSDKVVDELAGSVGQAVTLIATRSLD